MTDGGSSIPEVHRLLCVLAAGRRAAEIGTAFGDGAAAIASTAASLVTVEVDPERARVARERLPADVTVLEGDWRELLQGPFEFVFVDGGGQETKADPTVIELGGPGAIYLLDDMTPGRPGPDPVRELWLGDPRLAAVEILTTPQTAAIVATRLG